MRDEADARQVVEAWIAGVNAGDIEGAAESVADDVGIIGPRGTTSGRERVAEWIRHTGIRIASAEFRVEADRVTVEAEGTWRIEGGEPGERTSPAPIVIQFQVQDGRISSIERL